MTDRDEQQLEWWRKRLKHYQLEVELQKEYDKRIQEINETKKRISQLEKLIKIEKRKLRELKNAN